MIKKYFLQFFHLVIFTCLLPAASIASESTELFSKIKSYADLANAAYLPRQDALKVIEAQGYQLDQYSNVPEVEVNYFVATNDELKHHIIGVRGTANIENAVVDASLKLLPDEHTKISLHQGFSVAAKGIYEAVRPSLNNDYEISTTGHSLGGAVAVILAMYLDIDNYKLGPITTFGQPKVTNVSGALKFRHLNISRVVTPHDLVPLVPPIDMMDINKIDIYWHLGKEIILLDGYNYATLDGVKNMMRATKIIETKLSLDNIEHHKMTAYLAQITPKIETAKLVAYDTEFNVLKLFGR